MGDNETERTKDPVVPRNPFLSAATRSEMDPAVVPNRPTRSWNNRAASAQRVTAPTFIAPRRPPISAAEMVILGSRPARIGVVATTTGENDGMRSQPTPTKKRNRLATGLVATLTLALGGMLVAPTTADAAAFECLDESNLCIEGSGRFQADRRSNSKDRKKRSKRSAGTLTIRIEGGRGSVFINGRYAGTAPLEGVEVPSGNNDLQIRDGADVLATGLLTVPRDGDVVAVVRHP